MDALAFFAAELRSYSSSIVGAGRPVPGEDRTPWPAWQSTIKGEFLMIRRYATIAAATVLATIATCTAAFAGTVPNTP
ncbi:hypothetical protein ACIRRH_36045 [Kitasatospora sp. NPDC101235]|uniref:hypothetical protein n=1 Tax=Kitasatospora sp. NPDC101235 TaxID=3364101 RepID=UPI00380E6271